MSLYDVTIPGNDSQIAWKLLTTLHNIHTKFKLHSSSRTVFFNTNSNLFCNFAPHFSTVYEEYTVLTLMRLWLEDNCFLLQRHTLQRAEIWTSCVGTNFSISWRHQHVLFAYVLKFEGNYGEAANCNSNTDKFPVLDLFYLFT